VVSRIEEEEIAMIKYMLRLIIAVLAITSISSCVTPQQNQVKRFRGYWASGEGYSWFTLLDDSRTYWVFAGDIPDEAAKYLMRQAKHQSPYSATRDCRAIYLEILGTVEEFKSITPENPSHLHVNKILKMEPAPAEFFKSGGHPLPY